MDLKDQARYLVIPSPGFKHGRNSMGVYKRIGYSLDIIRQTACLVVHPIIVDGYASFFN